MGTTLQNDEKLKFDKEIHKGTTREKTGRFFLELGGGRTTRRIGRHICIYLNINVCKYICISIYICIHIYTYIIHIYIYICIIYVYICIHIYMDIHIYLHTFIFKYIHICRPMRLVVLPPPNSRKNRPVFSLVVPLWISLSNFNFSSFWRVVPILTPPGRHNIYIYAYIYIYIYG